MRPFFIGMSRCVAGRIPVLAVLLGVLLITGCNKNVLFRTSQPLTPGQVLDIAKKDSLPEHLLKTDDMLTISVLGHDDLSVGSIYAPLGGSTKESGKWVIIDVDGEVVLPLIGRIKLADLTIKEGELYLQTLYSKFLESPRITLRVVNRTISVLGEVSRPGNFPVDKQQITLLEALSVAGGFTDNARPSKVQLIRNKPNTVETYIIDLTRLSSLSEPKLLLQSGDVIYVPPRRTKFVTRTGSNILPFISIITGLILIFSTFGNK